MRGRVWKKIISASSQPKDIVFEKSSMFHSDILKFGCFIVNSKRSKENDYMLQYLALKKTVCEGSQQIKNFTKKKKKRKP